MDGQTVSTIGVVALAAADGAVDARAMLSRVALVGALTLGLGVRAVASVAGPLAPVPSAAVVYRSPLPTPLTVIHPFNAPASPYAAGERGVDLSVVAGVAVAAAGPGVVRFAGQVAGRGVVVITHPDGITTEYEPLTSAVARGQVVSGGQVIGVVSGTHPGCEANTCLHWAARRDGRYFDPLSLLRPLGVVRLLPWT